MTRALTGCCRHKAIVKANIYVLSGTTMIDNHFGDGYAKAHPELLATYVEVAARNFNTCVRDKRDIDLVDKIETLLLAVAQR